MNKFLIYIFILFFTFTSSVNVGYSNAINRGKTGAGIFSLKNFGNENTNGMSKTEWIIANADKDTISNGNLGLVSDLYNTATKKGEGEPFIISSIVTGLVVAGSLYSIQDSARKIYAWIDGKGYKGNTTYIDPIDGRIYTAEENLKEEETRKFVDTAFRDGSVKTSGTDIDKLMPPMTRFGGGNRAEKKKTIIEKLVTFFDRFFGIG